VDLAPFLLGRSAAEPARAARRQVPAPGVERRFPAEAIPVLAAGEGAGAQHAEDAQHAQKDPSPKAGATPRLTPLLGGGQHSHGDVHVPLVVDEGALGRNQLLVRRRDPREEGLGGLELPGCSGRSSARAPASRVLVRSRTRLRRAFWSLRRAVRPSP
jgi:hypothetical protein